jgi:hypothetical protein
MAEDCGLVITDAILGGDITLFAYQMYQRTSIDPIDTIKTNNLIAFLCSGFKLPALYNILLWCMK